MGKFWILLSAPVIYSAVVGSLGLTAADDMKSGTVDFDTILQSIPPVH